MAVRDNLDNPIEEYFKDSSEEDNSKELFNFNLNNLSLKTDLSFEELIIINKIESMNSIILENIGINIYGEFLNNHKKLKISLDRKSRSEFVDVNRKDRFKQNLQEFGNFSNLMKVRE